MAQPEVSLLVDPDDLAAAVALFGTVWPDRGDMPYGPDLLPAVVFAGGYVAGARLDGRLVGASFGMLGRHDDQWVLHSHVTGVLPGFEHAGIGLCLKLHQREWARGQGLVAITWTFDPLVRRNGYFNLAKLGGRVVDYVESFYGPLTDAINADDETDRAIVWWPAEPAKEPPAKELHGSAFVVVDGQGDVFDAPPTAAVLHVHTPDDIVACRRTDVAAARRWRAALRRGFGDAVRAGFVATNCSRAGVYTLERV